MLLYFVTQSLAYCFFFSVAVEMDYNYTEKVCRDLISRLRDNVNDNNNETQI